VMRRIVVDPARIVGVDEAGTTCERVSGTVCAFRSADTRSVRPPN
jgi:hypothetical protein